MEQKDRRSWCMDIETLFSCFTYTAINIDTEEIVKFVIHKDRNDLEALIDHLGNCKGQIGFNNQNFDYPVLHFILENCRIDKWVDDSNEEIISQIYREAQRLINNHSPFGNSIRYKDVLIPQLDLFLVWHYNNKARMTSLKSLEISMNYPNVMDMPIEHTKEDITLEEVDDILEYNLNDVLATYEFYKKSIEKINLRKSLIKQYGIPCLNYSDSKIGESLILKLYCDKVGANPYEVKKLRSNRLKIALNEIILPYIKFDSKEFNDLLTNFKSKVITETKGSISESVIYKGFIYDYGSGGIHGCIKPGIYISDNKSVIIDADVGSLYPNLAIKNGFYIEHLGKEFIQIYDEDIVQKRLKAKKEGNNAISDALKLSANSVYGKSNDEYSFLYDPKYTMATTINGQLLLTMLCEKLVNTIPELTMLQVNTDGITVKIPKKWQDVYYNICKAWENCTKLSLEYNYYDKMVIQDVNNYTAVTDKGKIKNKGCFEVDKMVGNEHAYHKDNSFRIIPLAIQEYFVNNIPIEQTIKDHKDIYDFCGRQKFKGKDYGKIHELSYDEANNPVDISIKQQKNVRYYISNIGHTFHKYYAKGDSEVINKGYSVTIFNKFEEKENYDINYSFYIKECNKIIENIESKQLILF